MPADHFCLGSSMQSSGQEPCSLSGATPMSSLMAAAAQSLSLLCVQVGDNSKQLSKAGEKLSGPGLK